MPPRPPLRRAYYWLRLPACLAGLGVGWWLHLRGAGAGATVLFAGAGLLTAWFTGIIVLKWLARSRPAPMD